MATAAISSQGIVLKRGDGMMTEAFVAISEVVSFTGPGGQTTIIDASSLESASMEKLIGLPDEGQITLELNFIPSSTSQKALRTDRTGRLLRNFKLAFPGTPAFVMSFAAYVTAFSIAGSTNEKITASVTLEISGAVTEGTT